MNERLLRAREVCERIGFGATTLREWVNEGKFPQPIQLFGKGHPRFLESEVNAWIEEQIRLSRGEDL